MQLSKRLKNIFCRILFCFLCCFFVVQPAIAKKHVISEHVYTVKIFVDETISLLKSTKITNKQKRQAIIDKYKSNIDFIWIAKNALGRMYLQLSEEERNVYINEFTKFFIYTWLPKLVYNGKNKIDVKVLDKSVKVTDTDENVTLLIKIGKSEKYKIILRTRISKDGKFQVLNLSFEGIDLMSSYKAQFSDYIEEHKNDPKSIISYLKLQNKNKKNFVDFKC